ncbi:hypothetical protein CTI12_AA296280 [Artemisia annua]|uniref:RING-type E3 ubiquitin transferase n=1 Tax=Artemisia annua TaxID=35608 RepID=A0A2U1N7Q3_ARTAN|nr:hypothetical protein CTI12_AA296280 [Artemisia annua]
MLAPSPSGNIPGTTPLLYEDDRNRRSLRRQSLRDAARFLRRASSRRMMREPSMLVRETAAEQLEERQSDWAYSKPVVILDLVWNFAFVVVAFVVLVLSQDEVPVTWNRRDVRFGGGGEGSGSGGSQLCVIFLAFDVFFVVFCVALACVIGIAVCCCLPCIIAVLYAVADQEGATKEDIELLPKFTFRRDGGAGKTTDEIQGLCGGVMTEYGTDSPIEHVLSPEDAECCICLSAYDDGAELRELPCSHHFHCSCIDKWLYINATCPLCKYNIVKNQTHGCEEA